MLNIVQMPNCFTGDAGENVLENVSSKLETAHGFLAVFLEPGGTYSHIWESASGRISDNELLGVMEKIKFDLIVGTLDEDEEEAF